MNLRRKVKELTQDASNAMDSKEILNIINGIYGFSKLSVLLDNFDMNKKILNTQRRLRPVLRFHSKVVELLEKQKEEEPSNRAFYQKAIDAIKAVTASTDVIPAAKNHIVMDIIRVSLQASGNNILLDSDKKLLSSATSIDKLATHIPRLDALTFSVKTFAMHAINDMANKAERCISSLSGNFGLFKNNKSRSHRLSTPAKALANFCAAAQELSVTAGNQESSTKNSNVANNDYFLHELMISSKYSPF